MWKKFLVAACLMFLFPLSVSAAGVGFVPSAGIWLARTMLQAGELARVYTVVVNNDYFALEGEVGFYDNNNLIEKVNIKRLPRESAVQLRVFWQPTIGQHILSSRFISAISFDEQGVRAALDVSAIGGTVGAPLMVVDKTPGVVVPGQDSNNQTSAPNGGQTLTVEVTKQGNQIVVGGAPPTTAAGGMVLGIKEMGAATKNLFDQISSTVHSNSLSDAFNKNREALAGASGAVDQVTSTVAGVNSAYAQAGQFADKGRAAYGQAQHYWSIAAPYAAAAAPWWQRLSDNNNPMRILEIFIALVVLWFILKRLRRLFFVMFVLRHTKRRR